MDPLALATLVTAVVTLVNAVGAAAALIIHSWNHTHTRKPPPDAQANQQSG